MEQKEKRGSLTEVLSRINYYESALKNPTKDPREARDSLYGELDRLGAYVTNGVTSQDFDRINERVRNLPESNWQRLTSMIDRLKEKANKKEIGEGDAIALITDLGTEQIIAVKVPSRR